MTAPIDPRPPVPPIRAAGPGRTFAENLAIVDAGLGTFVDVGTALAQIRDERQYKATHGTFEALCQERWGLSRKRAYDYIAGAQVVEEMSPMGDTPPIANERQARALSPVIRDLGPEAAAEVLAEAAATGHVTASGITEAAKRRADAYTRREPTQQPERKPRRRPLPDQARTASYDLRKTAERLARITNDDRLPQHKEQVRVAVISDLRRAIETLTTALRQLELEGILP